MNKQKYTEEQEIEMQAMYQSAISDEEREEVVLELADRYRKNKRMIIAKLSNMGIYLPKPRISKVTGGTPETKEQMIRRLEIKLGWPPGDFAGLEKAPKLVIQKLLEEYKC